MNGPATPEQALLRRTARRIALQTAALFAVGALVIAGLAGAFILRAENADGQRQLTAAVADEDAVTDPPSGIMIYRSDAGRIRASPQLDGRPIDPAGFAAVLAGAPTVTGTVTAHGRHYQVRTVRKKGSVVQAALDLTDLNRERRRLAVALISAGLAGLVGALAIGYFIARRAVRPLELASLRQRRFVADASHELRTPLTQAHTRAQLLHRALIADGDHPDLADDAGRLVRSTRQLGDIVEELLLSAQLRTDPQTVTPVDLAVVAADVVDAEQVRGIARDVTIEIIHDVGPHVVAGSPTALRRVVSSLVDNALGHVDDGGRITVSITRLDGKNPAVICTVADNGHGFDPTNADTIFERFARGNHSDPRRFGLGLALVREVVEAHRGSITAASVPEHGATFIVSIPACPA